MSRMTSHIGNLPPGARQRDIDYDDEYDDEYDEREEYNPDDYYERMCDR